MSREDQVKEIEKIRTGIKRGITTGKNLFLCGVHHYECCNLLRISRIIEFVRPKNIFLEGYDPTNIYSAKGIEGERFKKEIVKGRCEMVPNLIDIVSDIDTINAVARGIELTENQKQKLITKNKLKKSELRKASSIFYEDVKDFLDEHPDRLTTPQYHALERMMDAFYEEGVQGNDVSREFDLNVDAGDAINTLRIIESVKGGIPKGLGRSVANVKRVIRNIQAYGLVRDKIMFNNMMKDYSITSAARNLVVIGAAHITDDPFIKFVERAKLPYHKFNLNTQRDF